MHNNKDQQRSNIEYASIVVWSSHYRCNINESTQKVSETFSPQGMNIQLLYV